MNHCQKSNRQGFTLVELLVVIGIIALLIAVLMPALRKARISAQTVTCASNMRQLANAVIQYASENKGMYPTTDAMLHNPNNANAFLNYNWWTPPLVGRYVGNTSTNPNVVTNRVFHCPALPIVKPGSVGNAVLWGTDFGIGYNVSSSIRNNYLYTRWPNVSGLDPANAATYQTSVNSMASYNQKVARMGKVKRPDQMLVFVDVGNSGSRFIQLYNGAARTVTAPNTGANGTYATAPANDAVSYRHGKRTNVAFLDGHVTAFAADDPDDNQLDTHKNQGIHAEFLAGRLRIDAR